MKTLPVYCTVVVYLCRVTSTIGDGTLLATPVNKDKRAAPSQRTGGVNNADATEQTEYEERIRNWFNQDGTSDHVRDMCGKKILQILILFKLYKFH